MRQALETLIMKDLDASKPLWRVHLVPADPASGELPVALFRIHHCIGDGAALGPIFDALSSDNNTNALQERFNKERERQQQAGRLSKAIRGIAVGFDSVKSFVSN